MSARHILVKEFNVEDKSDNAYSKHLEYTRLDNGMYQMRLIFNSEPFENENDETMVEVAEGLALDAIDAIRDCYPHIFNMLYAKGYEDGAKATKAYIRDALKLNENTPERPQNAAEGAVSKNPSKETGNE